MQTASRSSTGRVASPWRIVDISGEARIPVFKPRSALRRFRSVIPPILCAAAQEQTAERKLGAVIAEDHFPIRIPGRTKLRHATPNPRINHSWRTSAQLTRRSAPPGLGPVPSSARLPSPTARYDPRPMRKSARQFPARRASQGRFRALRGLCRARQRRRRLVEPSLTDS